MFDRDDENDHRYELLEAEEQKTVAPGMNARISLFALPTVFMRVSYDGLNAISVLPYSQEIPSLRQMINAVIASQLQYLIADIEQAIKDNSRINWRRSVAITKQIFSMAVFGFLMVYGCIRLLWLLKDLNDNDLVTMDNAYESLINSCHSVFSVINETCAVLANDPPICAEKPDNCPTGNCMIVKNLLEKCDFWNIKLTEDTHDTFPYSTHFNNRLVNCEGSGWVNFTDNCSGHYGRDTAANGYVAALVFVILVGSLGVLWPIVSWFRGLDMDVDEKYKVEERERILNWQFKDLLPAEKYEENPAFKLLLGDAEEDASCAEILSKLKEFQERGFEYSTQRFFRRPAESTVQIEVGEEKAELLRNVS